jgi:hypothetical protein
MAENFPILYGDTSLSDEIYSNIMLIKYRSLPQLDTELNTEKNTRKTISF